MNNTELHATFYHLVKQMLTHSAFDPSILIRAPEGCMLPDVTSDLSFMQLVDALNRGITFLNTKESPRLLSYKTITECPYDINASNEHRKFQALTKLDLSNIDLTICFPEGHPLYSSIRELNVMNSPVSDLFLGRFQNLEVLSVNGANEYLEFLKDKSHPMNKSLRELTLGTKVKPASLVNLQNLTKLDVTNSNAKFTGFDFPMFKTLLDLDISYSTIDDDDLFRFQKLRSLKSRAVSEVTLLFRKTHPIYKTLESLDIYGKQFSDDELQRFYNLKKLFISSCDLTMDFLEDGLHPLCDSLEELEIYNMTFDSDRFIMHLRKLKKLTLYSTNGITLSFLGEGSIRPPMCHTLEELTLVESTLTDEAISHLSNLKTINFLDSVHGPVKLKFLGVNRDHPLNETLEVICAKVNDESLLHVRNLKNLNIIGSHVTFSFLHSKPVLSLEARETDGMSSPRATEFESVSRSNSQHPLCDTLEELIYTEHNNGISLQHFRNLKYVFSHGDVDMSFLYPSHPLTMSLKKLEILNNTLLTDDNVRHLRCLREMTLDTCENVSLEFLKKSKFVHPLSISLRNLEVNNEMIDVNIGNYLTPGCEISFDAEL